MSMVETERVLVVPAEVLHGLGYFQGFTSDVGRYLDGLLRPEHTAYRPRSEMEKDPSFKQLIPYVIFRHTDESGHEKIFQYTRGTGQGERRLHRKISIGVGGHIASTDAGRHDSDPYREGMRRELEEEVIIETDYRARCVGLINDDLTDVGKVHLGVVHVFDVAQPQVRPREPEILDAGFRPLPELRANRQGMESWSQICFDALFGASLP